MTSKQKADELFDLFYIICQEYTEEIQCSIQAKECALLCINQHISTLKTYRKKYNEFKNMDDEIRFWNGVKQKLLKK